MAKQMTKEEQALLEQLDGTYTAKRLSEMIKLQNKLATELIKAKLPSQDALMVLTVLARQVEARFIGRLQPQQEEKKDG